LLRQLLVGQHLIFFLIMILFLVFHFQEKKTIVVVEGGFIGMEVVTASVGWTTLCC